MQPVTNFLQVFFEAARQNLIDSVPYLWLLFFVVSLFYLVHNYFKHHLVEERVLEDVMERVLTRLMTTAVDASKEYLQKVQKEALEQALNEGQPIEDEVAKGIMDEVESYYQKNKPDIESRAKVAYLTIKEKVEKKRDELLEQQKKEKSTKNE